MSRLWQNLTALGAVAAVILIAGLMVRTVAINPEGLWLGPWPLEGADDCRTRIFADGKFDVECKGRDRYVAMGSWYRQSNTVRFEFSHFTRNGSDVREPKPITLRTDGAKNVMFVGRVGEPGEPFRWRRGRP
jgi:hypothetical protein